MPSKCNVWIEQSIAWETPAFDSVTKNSIKLIYLPPVTSTEYAPQHSVYAGSEFSQVPSHVDVAPLHIIGMAERHGKECGADQNFVEDIGAKDRRKKYLMTWYKVVFVCVFVVFVLGLLCFSCVLFSVFLCPAISSFCFLVPLCYHSKCLFLWKVGHFPTNDIGLFVSVTTQRKRRLVSPLLPKRIINSITSILSDRDWDTSLVFKMYIGNF